MKSDSPAINILRQAKSLSFDQVLVLGALTSVGKEIYLNMKQLAYRTTLSEARARVVVRQLARKGLAQYSSGLLTEDGEVAGSGYCATNRGRTGSQIVAALDRSEGSRPDRGCIGEDDGPERDQGRNSQDGQGAIRRRRSL